MTESEKEAMLDLLIEAFHDLERIGAVHDVDIGAGLTHGWVEIHLKLGPKPDA